MATGGYKLIRLLGMTVVLGALALFTGCATYAHSTTVARSPAPEAEPEDRQADEFIGTPIMGDYDNEEDLDFVLEVKDGDKVFKIEVFESAGGGNRALLEQVRQRVNAMEDTGSIRVIGYYSSEYRGSSKEYGFLDLKMIAFFDEETGKEEAFFTDPQNSPFYTQSDVTVVYAPGHHYSTIHYPRYVSPWWDNDGDGIPNRYDPWPYSYDTWYDYNMNYIPDWYDPYYSGYYSYWNYWNVNFWAGNNWYSPHYFRHGYNTAYYYDDYRTYTRLYDRRHVNNRDNSNRRMLRLDAKSEHLWKKAYERDRSNTTRVARSAPGTRSYRGYESRPVDSRVLVDASLRNRASSTNSRNRVVSSGGARDNNLGNDTFTRNRVTSSDPAVNPRTRGRVRVAGTDKTKTSRAVSTTRTRSDRASVSSRTAGSRGRVRGSEGGSSSATASSRSRNVSSGRTTTSSSSGRSYKPSSRSRSGGSSAVRGSSSGSSGSSRVRSSGGSKPSTAGSSGGSVTRSRSSSGSRSAPAARSSSSGRSRSSGSAPAARSSSRSRSSGSSSSAKSSSSSSKSRSRSRN